MIKKLLFNRKFILKIRVNIIVNLILMEFIFETDNWL